MIKRYKKVLQCEASRKNDYFEEYGIDSQGLLGQTEREGAFQSCPSVSRCENSPRVWGRY